MTFVVSQQYIDKGRQQSGYYCPVALAIYEAFSDVRVYVGNTLIEIGKDKYTMPAVLGAWIDEYDYAEEPRQAKPIAFELPIEEDSNASA